MTQNQNELRHYGVIGMKWGVRKAQKTGGSYTYKSYGTKKYAKKAEKYRKKGDTEKAEKYDTYHKRSTKLDRKMQKNAEANTLAETAVKTYLTAGNLGGRTYEVTRAVTRKTPGDISSETTSMAISYINQYLTGPIGATPIRALYVRGYIGDEE